MKYGIRIVLPDDVMEQVQKLPKSEVIPFLSKYLDDASVEPYQASLQRRQTGVLGGPLSRYERAVIKDHDLDIILRQLRPDLEEALGTSTVRQQQTVQE